MPEAYLVLQGLKIFPRKFSFLKQHRRANFRKLLHASDNMSIQNILLKKFFALPQIQPKSDNNYEKVTEK